MSYGRTPHRGHGRRNSGRWYFLDLDKEDPSENAYYVGGMDWLRPIADELVGGKWLGYPYTHGFLQWLDLSGDRPVCYDTQDPNSTVAKTSQPNYLGTGGCCKITDDKLLLFDDNAAIAAITNWVAGGTSAWSAYVGGGWTPLSGDIAPAEGATFVVRLEGDFSLASPRVRFAVSADGGTTFVPLSNAATGAEWLVPSDATRRALAEVATTGKGRLGGIFGALSNAWVAEAGGMCYVSLAEALRAAGPGVRVTLLANATVPASLAAGRDIDENGHVLIVFEDFGGTLILLQ